MTPLLATLLLFAILGLVLLSLAISSGRRSRALQERYEEVLAEHGLTMTDRPCGLSDEQLASFDLLPPGDRASSAVWGAEGQELVRVGARDVPVTCAAFEWWWESFVTAGPRPGHERSSRMAALVTFPAAVAFDEQAISAFVRRQPGAEVEVRDNALLVALAVLPRGIVRMRARVPGLGNEDLASTSPEPIEMLAGLRADALALAAVGMSL